MALSRIWTGFIIVALLVAACKFVFQPGQQGLFSQLVTGKRKKWGKKFKSMDPAT